MKSIFTSDDNCVLKEAAKENATAPKSGINGCHSNFYKKVEKITISHRPQVYVQYLFNNCHLNPNLFCR